MLTLVVPQDPVEDPVTAAEAKTYARVHSGFTGHDTMITEMITAARIKFEEESGYHLGLAQYVWTPESWEVSAKMRLPLRPLSEISSITVDGEELVENTDFTVTIDEKGWGFITFTTTPVEPEISFIVGGVDQPKIELVKLALKSLVAHWYNTPEAYTEKRLGPVERTWDSTIRTFRIA